MEVLGMRVVDLMVENLERLEWITSLSHPWVPLTRLGDKAKADQNQDSKLGYVGESESTVILTERRNKLAVMTTSKKNHKQWTLIAHTRTQQMFHGGQGGPETNHKTTNTKGGQVDTWDTMSRKETKIVNSSNMVDVRENNSK
jgi:hypothetical protein